MAGTLALIFAACAAAPARIEFVESTPRETTLDSSLADAADVWPAMIARAKSTIDVAQFYVSIGPKLERSIAALEAAIARGVTVRLLVEHSFVKVYPETIARLAKAGAVVKEANFDPGILHAKYFVIDRTEAYLGSQNFDWRALDHIVELGVRITDAPTVAALSSLFAYDWDASPTSTSTSGGVRPASSGLLVASPRDRLPPGVRWDLPVLIDLLAGAKRSIRVELLTYLAGEWTELEAPLLAAAARGVKIEMLVSTWTKREKTLAGILKLAATPNVEIRFVDIPEASTGFIPFARTAHAKLLVVDDVRGWIGTSNWEREYFYESRNVGIVVEDARPLARFFDGIWRSKYAVRVDPNATYTPPRISANINIPLRRMASWPTKTIDMRPMP